MDHVGWAEDTKDKPRNYFANVTGTNVNSQDDRKSMSLGVSADCWKQFKYILSQVSMIKLDNKSEGEKTRQNFLCASKGLWKRPAFKCFLADEQK